MTLLASRLGSLQGKFSFVAIAHRSRQAVLQRHITGRDAVESVLKNARSENVRNVRIYNPKFESTSFEHVPSSSSMST